MAITCLLIFLLTVDPIAARFPGAVTGLATSWRLNRSMSGAPGAFPANAVTLISRIVSVGLFSLLQWRSLSDCSSGPSSRATCLFCARSTGPRMLRPLAASETASGQGLNRFPALLIRSAINRIDEKLVVFRAFQRDNLSLTPDCAGKGLRFQLVLAANLKPEDLRLVVGLIG